MKTKITFLSFITLISLTVLVFQSCGEEDEPDEPSNQAPNCQISSPVNGAEISQGETVTINVSASDSDGNIKAVRFAIDGVARDTVRISPYTYNWETNNESIGPHTLKATSVDNDGRLTSDEITVQLVELSNSPTAIFTVYPTIGDHNTIFTFDASSSWDLEDPPGNLEVRWDFDGNGNWDTDWDSDKIATHQYYSGGDHSAELEVRDTDGMIGSQNKNVTVINIFTDPRDNQTYDVVTIGSQVWLAENLNYTTSNSYRYDNSVANSDIYGRLYTWYAAQIACPDGWHLPSDSEWKTMEMALGMSQTQANGTGWRGTDEGGKMKETGTTYWITPNTGATNSSGFAARPGGYRHSNGNFAQLGYYGYWWTATENSSSNSLFRGLSSSNSRVNLDEREKLYSYSVRCIKD